MEKWLDVTAALFAIVAAVFWFRSAYRKLPPFVAYWGQTPDSDPFYKAVRFSAKMNRLAAAFSCASALSLAARLFMGNS